MKLFPAPNESNRITSSEPHLPRFDPIIALLPRKRANSNQQYQEVPPTALEIYLGRYNPSALTRSFWHCVPIANIGKEQKLYIKKKESPGKKVRVLM